MKARGARNRRPGPSVATALIEPNILFREGLERILAPTRFQVVMRTDNVSSLGVATDRGKTPAIFVLWTEGSSDLSRSDVTKLKCKYAGSQVVCIGESYRTDEVVDLLRAGADGILLRSINADAFIKSLELVLLGERVIPPASLTPTLPQRIDAVISLTTSRPIEQVRPAVTHGNCGPQLSVQELAILKCLVQGEANKIIAFRLHIAEATVKVHVKTILRKIHVKNRTQAAIWALGHLADGQDTANAPMKTNGHANDAMIRRNPVGDVLDFGFQSTILA
ncbi:LuxR C-terminal-related transcriptional regulator [Methylobacterium marchantiae]|uniref:LuxR C-terminal-related transcriptional regulator n=1 Tax=Methylobacterium marchantiae TaxID=600331 RepID=A0ABW3X414_9HYPH